MDRITQQGQQEAEKVFATTRSGKTIRNAYAMGYLSGYNANRWIPVTPETMPKEEDADREGNILVANVRFTQIVKWDFQYIPMYKIWCRVPDLSIHFNQDFYCRAKDEEGALCEEQCERCAKTNDFTMPIPTYNQ